MVDLEYSASAIGTKAFNLYRMQSAGIRIPEFFVLPDYAFQEDVKVIRHKIAYKLSKLAAKHYAVRSSSNLEDGENASFAGLFETILNVPKEDVVEAVLQVFSSASSHQLYEYCISKNIAVEKVKISVIVQAQINSISSGICITHFDFSPDCLYVEACRGQCAAIADGRVVPSCFQINRSTQDIVTTEHGDQSIILTCNGSGGLQETKSKTNVLELPVLSKKQLLEITNTALNIEKIICTETVDMEWTFDEENFYVLQARPYIKI